MLLGGDEFGRSQGGNNNGWCQDSEISWFDWALLETNADLLEFTRKLIALRRAHAVFRRRQFLFGREIEGSGLPDAAWFRANGERDARRGLGRAPRRSSACSSTARRSPRRTRAGARCSTSRSCCCSTATTRTHTFTVPDGVFGEEWTVVLDTADDAAKAEDIPAGAEIELIDHSLVLLRRVSE